MTYNARPRLLVGYTFNVEAFLYDNSGDIIDPTAWTIEAEITRDRQVIALITNSSITKLTDRIKFIISNTDTATGGEGVSRWRLRSKGQKYQGD
jgi:hypothetical protein